MRKDLPKTISLVYGNTGWLALALITLLISLAIAPVACTAPTDSADELTAQGFTDVKLGGYAWFACGRDDSFATNFEAKNQAGKPVTGVVCCGWMKACTIRGVRLK